jgi:FAD/FMN-containing dehydrogenase
VAVRQLHFVFRSTGSSDKARRSLSRWGKSALLVSTVRLLVDFLVVGAAASFLMRESEAPESRVASFRLRYVHLDWAFWIAAISGTFLVAFLIIRRHALGASVEPVADVLKISALWCLLFVLLPLSVRRTLGASKVHKSLPLVAAGLLLVSVDAVVVVDPRGPGDLGRLVGVGGLALLAAGLISFALGLGLVPAIIVHARTQRFLIWWLYGAFAFPVALVHAVFRRARPPTASSARQRWARALVILVPVLLYASATLRNKLILFTSPPSDDQYCLSEPSHSSTASPSPPTANVPGSVPLVQEGGTINDASCLNETGVFGIVRPTTIKELRQTLAFARAKGLGVSIAGARHSMGGQAFVEDGLVIDMTAFDQMTVDPKRNVLTVQSGATWKKVQDFLDPHGLSVKAMQSVNPLTVGGTIAVNAHGIDHRVGAIESTIRSLRVMLSDGTLLKVSRHHEPELFRSIVGGYGLLGVIVDAEIEVTANEMYQLERRVIDYREFPNLFEAIGRDDQYELLYGHLSTAPHSFLREMLLYTYRSADRPEISIPPVQEAGYVKVSRLTFNIAKTGSLGRWTKWMVEKYVLPHVRPCFESRNQALTAPEACLVSRNQAMYSSTDALKSSVTHRTEILQEYFVPRHRLVEFIDGLRGALADKKADLLNASIRVVHKDDLVLSYANDDVFAVVLYFSQSTNSEGNADMGRLTRQLIEVAESLDGSFYLPYQLHYTKQQLRAAYPELDIFLELKTKYDPSGVFSSRLYEKYFG